MSWTQQFMLNLYLWNHHIASWDAVGSEVSSGCILEISTRVVYHLGHCHVVQMFYFSWLATFPPSIIIWALSSKSFRHSPSFHFNQSLSILTPLDGNRSLFLFYMPTLFLTTMSAASSYITKCLNGNYIYFLDIQKKTSIFCLLTVPQLDATITHISV